MKPYLIPPLTGIITVCRLCNQPKDDAHFKQSRGKRNGLVCRDLHGKTVSGFHVETNLQYLTKSENIKKAAKWNQESN